MLTGFEPAFLVPLRLRESILRTPTHIGWGTWPTSIPTSKFGGHFGELNLHGSPAPIVFHYSVLVG